MKSNNPYYPHTNPKELVFGVGLLQIVLAILVFFLMQCKPNDKSASVPAQGGGTVDTSAQGHFLVDTNYVHIAGHYSDEIKQKLRELEGLKFSKGAIADQVLDYLKRGENDFGEEFKFIDLRFVDRDYEINPKFGQEIPDLATIMKAFPNIRIKLMAYTDNVGDEKANEQLSANRAMAIKNGLEAAGIGGDRIEVNAFGEKYPVADNSTSDGRMLNNRIEMMILSK